LIRILVIGATGNVGRQVVSQLPATGVEVRALARNPHTAALPPHVDVVPGDLTLPETLEACLDGIDAVFLVWTAPPAAVAPAFERIVSRTRRIVFLSAPHKTAHPFFQGGQPNPVASLHAEIERLIEASGLPWTFLRPGMVAGAIHCQSRGTLNRRAGGRPSVARRSIEPVAHDRGDDPSRHLANQVAVADIKVPRAVERHACGAEQLSGSGRAAIPGVTVAWPLYRWQHRTSA